MKAIVVLRVSTESQEIDSQKAEMITFAKQCGYDEKDLVYVEAIGASAIKLDQKYMGMANRVKELILQGGISCVLVWEISRLGRNEVILMDFKEFFIKHKVQFICKNPSLKLLDDDGTVNTGTELAFSLFATMSKQEMQEKKSRFARAKKALARSGKYIGGNTVPYAYYTDGNEFVVKEDEAKVVRLVFDLYSTGKYSGLSLSKELQERGFNITEKQVIRIFRNKAYTGEPTGKLGIHYPQIISKELFALCEDVRKANKIEMRQGTRLVLGSKLVRCPECGAVCTSNSRHYICCRASHKHGCTNTFALRKEVAEDLLWRTAYTIHMDYLMEVDDTKKEEYRKEKEIVDEKIAEAERKMEDFVAKKDRIVDTYLEGLIDRKTRDSRLLKLQDDIQAHSELKASLLGKSMALARMIEGGQKDAMETFLDALEKMETETKFDIIHQHIEKLVARQVSFGKRDKRTHRPNAVEITVTSVYGQEYLFMYVPKYYKGHNLYVDNGKEWVGDYVTKVW